MRALAVIVAAALLALPACSRDAAVRAELTDVRRQMDRYRQQAGRFERRVHDLEDRVFVLEDKLDTAQVALGRRPDAVPRLPVVRKQNPRAAVPAPPAPPADDPPHGEPLRGPGPGNPEDVEIVYEGEAAREGGRRPVLRLHESDAPDSMVPVEEPAGRRPGRRAARWASEGDPDPLAVTDRIPVTPLPGAAAAGPPPADDGAPIAAYREAYSALQRKEHAAAIAGFQRFLARWPDHDYADNSQYWLAEAHYDQRAYETALLEFRRVVQRYPSGNKAPDALLKIGYCYVKLGDLPAARDVLSQVVDIYPRTSAARLAARRLEELRE